MLHINTRQIDSYSWDLQVTDGYHVQWTASFNGFQNNLMVIRFGANDHGKISGEVNLKGSNESELIGDAVALVNNWSQMRNQCNELLNSRWKVLNENLVHHRNY